MRKQLVAQSGLGAIVLVDSITQIDDADAGSVVIAASHGGSSSAQFALEQPLRLVVFNDAGVGKDQAGIAGLKILQDHKLPAATIAHTSARIGDSADMWENGVISYVNLAAKALGLRPGYSLRQTLLQSPLPDASEEGAR